MAIGELMATRIGAAFLHAEGIDVQWLDARTMLHAEERQGASERANYLSATCNFEPDTALQQRLAAGGKVLITQGFIASDAPAIPCCLVAADPTRRAATSRPSSVRVASRSGPTCPACSRRTPQSVSERPAAQVARLRRGAGNREQRRQGAAPTLHPAGEAVLHPHLHHATQHAGLDGTVVMPPSGDGGARVKAVCIEEGHHAALDGDARDVAPGRFPRGCIRRVQGRTACRSTSFPRPRPALRSPSIRRPTRSTVARSRHLVEDLSRALQGRGHRPLRCRQPGRAQHSRHAAPAGRRTRTVRGAEHLPRDASRERPQPDFRRGRGAGRPARAASARRHVRNAAVRSRAGPDVGTDPRRLVQ